MKLDAILFDIDGTLIDSNEQHVNAWAFAFREAGHPQELESIRQQIGKGGDLLVPALLPGAGEAVRRRIADSQGTHFNELYLDHVRPFPAATELLTKVHEQDHKIVLSSSAKRAEVDHYVKLLQADAMLSGMVSSDDVDASKPEPDIFMTALEKVGVRPDRAIVIGDTTYDVEAAARAGVVAIGLTSGPFSAKALKDAGAIAIFANVAELLEQFDRSPLAET